MHTGHDMDMKLTYLCTNLLTLDSQVHLTDNLEKLSHILKTDDFALVVYDHTQCKIPRFL